MRQASAAADTYFAKHPRSHYLFAQAEGNGASVGTSYYDAYRTKKPTVDTGKDNANGQQKQAVPEKLSAKSKRAIFEEQGIKISTGVICQAMKPLLGIFNGKSGNKAFRFELDVLTKDLVVRNCGPAFVLKICL